MREANVEQGVLVASGAFTVPAQRLAKDHHVTLVGREELLELLSAGAQSELAARQLEEHRARLEEARSTLREYAAELDALRQQRNEASWFLGEERARSGRLENQMSEVEQALRAHEAHLARWEQEAGVLRRRWEESQWYLGESQARVRHLDSQVTALQERARRVEATERARAGLETELAGLRVSLEESRRGEDTLQRLLGELRRELQALRLYGERRSCRRVRIAQAMVDLQEDGTAVAGTLRDVSRTGVGIESDQRLPGVQTLRVRVQVPGCEPIESQARLIWQRAVAQPLGYASGYRLVRVSASARRLLEQLIGQQADAVAPPASS